MCIYALSLQVETLHAEEQEEGGERIVARDNEKKTLAPAYEVNEQKNFKLQQGRLGKNPITTTNPSRNKPQPTSKNPKQKIMNNLI